MAPPPYYVSLMMCAERVSFALQLFPLVIATSANISLLRLYCSSLRVILEYNRLTLRLASGSHFLPSSLESAPSARQSSAVKVYVICIES